MVITGVSSRMPRYVTEQGTAFRHTIEPRDEITSTSCRSRGKELEREEVVSTGYPVLNLVDEVDGLVDGGGGARGIVETSRSGASQGARR